MAQIIPLNHLAEILAIRIGISDVEAQRFIQQYFETISYGLISGGEVSIKGLGTFARSSNADLAVTFTPDESLAKYLTHPSKRLSRYRFQAILRYKAISTKLMMRRKH